jgi:hypothetical protein
MQKEERKIDPSDTGHWILPSNVEEFGDNSKDYFGFVYKITLPNGLWYIGSKQFLSKRKLKGLKNSTRARRTVVESDWREYTSSSNMINDIISKEGKGNIKFEIITLVRGGKFELKYCEMKHQVLENCLFEENCMNQIVNVRLGKKKTFNF